MTPDSNRSKSPKYVYFLGAGASVFANIPTFNDFHNSATEIYNAISLEKENQVKELFEKVLGYWNKNFNEFNIEDFYSAVELDEMLSKDIIDKKKQEIPTSKDIENFIAFTIKRAFRAVNDNLYEIFLNGISSSNSAIITTNWDIALETSSRQFSLTEDWMDYESVQAYNKVNSPTCKPFSYPSCRVLKLHGSLNWGFCENCGVMYYFDEIYDELTLAKECKDDKCKKNGSKLKQIIVPPKLSKLVKSEEPNKSNSPKSPYSRLVFIWINARHYLKSCEKIYFIGYSFPETDVQMRILISNALRENSHLIEAHIISSPKHGKSRVDFEERYLSILPKRIKNKVKFNYDGFEWFCKNELPVKPVIY